MNDTLMLAIHHAVCRNECNYKCFLILCRQAEQSGTFSEFRLIAVGDAVQVSAEFHFAQVDYAVGTFDNQVDLKPRNPTFGIGLASPCGNRRAYSCNSQCDFNLLVVAQTYQLKTKSHPR